MSTFHTIDEIIEKALELIDAHELVRSPIVFNTAGSPIRITEYRDHDGFDGNAKGLTLSVFPYVYSSSSLTSTSSNAAIIYDPQHVGDRARGGYERGTLNLIVKLSTTGFEMVRTPVDDKRPVVMVRNEYERSLRKWLEILRAILLSNPLVNVAGYVKNSRVHYGDFKTTEWTGGKGSQNAVLHTAQMLWTLDFWPVRDLSRLPKPTLPGTSVSWQFVGIRSSDWMDVYYDTSVLDLYTLSGYPLQVTPQSIPVKWNPTTRVFEHRVTSVPLTNAQMLDPLAPAGKPWIDTGFKIVAVVKVPGTETTAAEQYHLYLRTADNVLIRSGGTVVTELWDGSALSYDPVTGRLVLVPAGPFSRDYLIDLTDPARVIASARDLTGQRPNETIRVD